MKNKLITLSFSVFLLIILVLACTKKKSSGISPGYEETGNPDPVEMTVTGTSTPTNPATQNTSLLVGGSGWSNPTCGTTNSISLKGINGTTDVTLSFSKKITAGPTQTFQVAPTPATGVCALRVVNAPGQPAGIIWIGKSGTVVVNTTTSSINATFTSIQCTQANFNFPVVSVSGTLACSQ
jgi:hypothetical protein